MFAEYIKYVRGITLLSAAEHVSTDQNSFEQQTDVKILKGFELWLGGL